MIEDPELRHLFQIESEERLQRLDEKLLVLEKDPGNASALEHAFREAHSLKGAARMLGITEVETLTHHFETTLNAARQGEAALSATRIDRLVRAVDAIRLFVRQAITGEPAPLKLPEVLAELEGSFSAPAPADTPSEGAGRSAPQAATPARSPAPGGVRASSAAAAAEPASRPVAGPIRTGPQPGTAAASLAEYHIETIRVKPQQLDTLMTLSSELNVTKIQIAQRLTELEELAALLEEEARQALAAPRTVPAPARNPALPRSAPLEPRTGARPLAAGSRLDRMAELAASILRRAREDQDRLEFVSQELEEDIRSIRLLPLAILFNLFPRMVRDFARQSRKEVELLLEGGETTADKRVLELLKDPLMHLIRNSIDHGVELPEVREQLGKVRSATLRLRARRTAASVIIEVQDDGGGLDMEKIKRTALQRGFATAAELEAMPAEEVQALIFKPSFSTSPIVTDLSGRGVGLDVVRATIEHLKGTIRIESAPGSGCTFRLQLPVTLATARILVVHDQNQYFGIPVDFVQLTHRVTPADVCLVEGRETVFLEGEPVSVVRLGSLLRSRARASGGATPPPGPPQLCCVFLDYGKARLGILVDRVESEQEAVLKPLGGLLRRVRSISSATILSTGEICLILDPHDLLRMILRGLMTEESFKASLLKGAMEQRKRTILLAEDSLTTRIQMKRILEIGGYEVVTAVDGLEAMNLLGTRAFDAVVSDVQMPNLDGLALAAKIREDPKHQELPIILVTSLASDEDRRRGVEAGASAYITKNSFDQTVLLDTMARFVI